MVCYLAAAMFFVDIIVCLLLVCCRSVALQAPLAMVACLPFKSSSPIFDLNVAV
jgi:hypothetical protein